VKLSLIILEDTAGYKVHYIVPDECNISRVVHLSRISAAIMPAGSNTRSNYAYMGQKSSFSALLHKSTADRKRNALIDFSRLLQRVVTQGSSTR
jgi:hypothetical protein